MICLGPANKPPVLAFTKKQMLNKGFNGFE